MYEYLKTLPLTDAQKQDINDAGYENAPTLYMICKATPVAMQQFLGLSDLSALEAALWELMDAVEQSEVEKELAELNKQ